jgi:hypothetical protein
MKGRAASTAVVMVVVLFSLPAVMAQGVDSPLTGAVNSQSSRQMPTITTLIHDPGPIGLATTTALFAHVAVGGGWNTVFTFVNTGTSSVAGSLILTSHDGTLMNVALADPAVNPQAGTTGGPVEAVGSSVPISIPVGGVTILAANPVSSSGSTQAGWARIESSGGQLGGVATFQEFNATGNLITTAGVLSADAVAAATIPVDNDDNQNRQVGYALANPGTAPLTVKAVVVNSDGSVKSSFNIQLAAGGQTATFLWQNDASLLKFRGSLVLIAQGTTNFSVVALVQNGSLYTVIPVIPGKVAGIN